MILDRIENAPRYYGLDPNLDLALQYLYEHCHDLSLIQEPTYLNPDIMVKASEYDTVVGTRKWESHLVNTDLQYVAEGEERFGYAVQSHAHDPVRTEGKDQIVWQAEGDRYYLPQGYFHIFLPGEVHMSKLAVDNKSTHVRKIVFKVRMKTAERGE